MTHEAPSLRPLLFTLLLGTALAAGAYWLLSGPGHDDLTPGSGLTGDETGAGGSRSRHRGPSSHALNALNEGHRAREVHKETGFGFGPAARETLKSRILSGHIRGLVKDESGEPIEEAHISLSSALPETFRTALPMGDFEAREKTDAEGRFRFLVPREGAFGLLIERTGYVSRRIRYTLPEDDLEIVLQRGVTLTGTVATAKTKIPLDGAELLVSDHVVQVQGQTDDKGVFVIKDLPDGQVDLTVFRPGFDLKRVKSVFLKKDEENILEVELREGAPLEGLVLDRAAGIPLKGARVAYCVGFREGRKIREVHREEKESDSSGRFLFEGVSRKGYRLEVTAEGFASRFLDAFPKIDQEGAILRIPMDREAGLAGRVLDPDGRPASRAEVRLVQADLWEKREISATTERDGTFRLEPVTAGKMTLFAGHRDHGPAILEGLVLDPGVCKEGVELMLAPACRIEGRVLGSDHEPVRGARVTLDGIRSFLTHRFHILPLTYSGGDGAFAFTNLPEGTFTLAASYGNARTSPVELEVLPGEQAEVELELDPGLILEGVVIDSFGEPLDDTLVTAFAYTPSPRKRNRPEGKDGNRARKLKGMQSRGFGSAWNALGPDAAGIFQSRRLSRYRGTYRSDQDGAFTLNGLLPDDLLVLRFWKYGYNGKQLPDVAPTQGQVLVTLDPFCQVQGRVVESSSFLPVSRFTLTLSNPDDRKAYTSKASKGISAEKKTKTDTKASRVESRDRSFSTADGSFLLESMKPGTYGLSVTSKGFLDSEPQVIEIRPDLPPPFVQVFLDRSGSLKGKVIGYDKSPIPGLTVHLVPSDSAPPATSSTKGDSTGEKSKKGKSAKNKKGKKKTVKPPPMPTLALKQMRTGPDGRFAFKDLEPRSYGIYVGNPKAPLLAPRIVRVTRGSNSARAFLFNEVGMLNLEVRDATAFGLKALVKLTGGPGQVSREARTDGLGRCRVKGLLPGKYKARVSASGYLPQTLSLMIDPKGETKADCYLDPKPTK